MSDRGVNVCLNCGLIDYRWNGVSHTYENCECDVALHKLARITTIIHTALVIQHHGDERERQGRREERSLVIRHLMDRAGKYEHESTYLDERCEHDVRAHALKWAAWRIDSGEYEGAARKAEGSHD